MYKITCTLEGTAPLMFNKQTEESLKKLDSGSTGGKKTIVQKEEEAYEKLHYTEDGHLCIPAWNLKQCIIAGAGLAGLTEKKRSLGFYFKGSLFVNGPQVFDPKRKKPDAIDTRPGRIPPGPRGAAAILRRPIINTGWILPVSITVIDDNRDPERVLQAMEAAGIYAGLGAFRPEYGRFIVRDFKATNGK